MAYDETLAKRLRRLLASEKGVSERKMFGGLCFLVNGNMLCGIDGNRCMFRVGKEREAEALSRPGATPMDFTGRPLGGFIWVDSTHCGDASLRGWVRFALQFVAPLPPKKKKAAAPRRSQSRRIARPIPS